jgi:hypothetical protein
MASRQSSGGAWLWVVAALGLLKGPARRLCAPPPIILQAIRWWVRQVRLWLAPRWQPLPNGQLFSSSTLPYGLYPLSCILLE